MDPGHAWTLGQRYADTGRGAELSVRRGPVLAGTLLALLLTGCASLSPAAPAIGGIAQGATQSAAKNAAGGPASGPQTPKRDDVAAGSAKQKVPPPLDLTSLEKRLRATEAIGEFTKLALKNQVADLLSQFRAFHHGTLKTTLAELRRPYDLLVLKVLSLLRDADPALAAAVVASREAIWAILVDPAKFAAI